MSKELPDQPTFIPKDEIKEKPKEPKQDPTKDRFYKPQDRHYLSLDELEREKEDAADTNKPTGQTAKPKQGRQALIEKVKEFNKSLEEKDKEDGRNTKINPHAPQSIVIKEKHRY